jgi:hypothetical protein
VSEVFLIKGEVMCEVMCAAAVVGRADLSGCFLPCQCMQLVLTWLI